MLAVSNAYCNFQFLKITLQFINLYIVMYTLFSIIFTFMDYFILAPGF